MTTSESSADDKRVQRRSTLAFSPTGTAFIRNGNQLERLGDQPELPEGLSCQVLLDSDAEESVWQVTACGLVKCTQASEFRLATRRAGVRGIVLDDGDRLAAVFPLAERTPHADVVIVTAGGIATRFSADDVSHWMGRWARGTRGIWLGEGSADELADVTATAFSIEAEQRDCSIGLLTANGHAVRFPASDLLAHTRGIKGVIACRTNAETGPVIFAALLLASGQAVGQSRPRQWDQVPWATVPVRPRRTGKWLRIVQPASPGPTQPGKGGGLPPSASKVVNRPGMR